MPADANCDGRIDDADRAAVAVALFEGTDCGGADGNGDLRITAADLPAVAINAGLPGSTTPTASPTLFITASPTITFPAPPTPTATPELCPTGGAELVVTVDNETGVTPIAVAMSGHLIDGTCRNANGLSETYSVAGTGSPQHVTQLAPGRWVHTLSVETPPTGQLQYRPSLLLAGDGPNTVRFTAFASVTTVHNPVDGLGSETFRDALLDAAAHPKPHLIQFDEVEFPSGVPTLVTLASALPPLSTDDVTIDGTDATGAAGNRGLDAGGNPNAALSITGGSNSIVGLRLRNTGPNNRDVLSISGPLARNNVIERCVIELSATGDGIGIDGGAGADFVASANVVRESEISGASDKGIKVTTNSYARVERSWVHDNVNGGIQATLSGHVLARDNLVERSTGAALAQNGLSVNGPAPDAPAVPSELIADGNIARFNAGNGLSLRGLSVGVITNNYFAANSHDGMRVASEGMPAAAVVQGTTTACNLVNGAVVEAGSQADFGGGDLGSPGDNAFTQNNLPAGADNLLNLTGSWIDALNNQWEHCKREPVCADDQIAAYDIRDHGRLTLFSPAQAHRSLRAPAVTGIRPSRGMAGDLIRIFGSGFNVIDGHAADATCPDLTLRNRCLPLRGNCVRIGAVAAPIEAITPTMLVVRLPISCVRPLTLTVATQGGGISAPVPVCTNSVP